MRRNIGDNMEPEVPQAPIDSLAVKVSHAELRATFHVFAQDMMTQEKREVVAPVNPIMGTMTMRIRYFIRMNPS